MRSVAAILGVLALVSQGVGCGGATEAPEGDEPVAAAAQAQLDLSTKSYWIAQSGTTQGGSWAGTVGGRNTEYWVVKPGYSASAARTFTGQSQTCGRIR